MLRENAGHRFRAPRMQFFSTLDLIALTFFLVAWFGYHIALEWTGHGAGQP